MKQVICILMLVVFVLITSSGCVSIKRFEELVDQVEYQHDILACESRVDAYEAITQSDEPDVTRRDEPIPTRRDEPEPTRRDLDSCLAEFQRVVAGAKPEINFPKCQPKLRKCATDTNLGVPKCRQCFETCIRSSDGTWPDTECGLQ